MLKTNNTDLAAALSRAASIVETRNTIPILSMVRLSADADRLSVTTTNLDIEYRQTLECASDGPLDVCVDAKRLSQMASAATSDIVIDADGSALKVKSGRSRWTAPTLPSDGFPSMNVDLVGGVEFDGAELASIIDRTVWSASQDGTKLSLQGLFFDAGTFVATNGHTLAMIETGDDWQMPSVIMPTDFLRAVQKSASGPCTLAWDDKKARFQCGDVTITGKLIDGSFPDYRRVIPQPCEPWAVETDNFAGAVRRARIVSQEKARKLIVKRGDGVVVLSMRGSGGFQSAEEVVADCSEGFESGVNADYLMGMLGAVDAESVSVEQIDPETPFVFRRVSQKPGMNFTGLVMGMRI